jgi:lipid II:glycine glycyltransferase (peptidoglycan interpeptide bridge formation enzyme)
MTLGLSEIPLDELPLDSSFLQSPLWARFKADAGWRGRAFSAYRGAKEFSFLVLERGLGRLGNLAYVPHGPSFDPGTEDRGPFLAALSRELSGVLDPATIAIRWDPPWYDPSGSAPLPLSPHLRRAVTEVQPPDTVIIDLSSGPEAVLGAMKPKWRYNVRLAEKKGVVVELVGIESLHEWYGLYQVTAQRDRISIHPEAYYSRLLELALPGSIPEARLYMARSKEGSLLAGIICVFQGEDAVYLYGASSNEGRELMPAYALQWRAMKDAMAMGCTRYDLFGIPPADDPSHPMHGLWRFKTGFGGMVIHRQGAWDYPLKPLSYQALRASESLRMLWHKRLKKHFGRKANGAR